MVTLLAWIAKAYGAEVPFLRSEKTASDTASSWDTVQEVLEGYSEIGKNFDTFCLLQPTSPLRTAQDIQNAYEIYYEKASLAVVSVCEAEHSPLWCGKLPDDNEFVDFISPESLKRRQDSGKFYRLNGAIYIVNIKEFSTEINLYQKGSYAYIMSQKRSIDIDTEIDFRLAETFINSN